MIFIERKLTDQEVEDLLNNKKTNKYAITDYAFEYLYDRGYIKTEDEFRGAHLKSNNGEYSLLCMTSPKPKNNFAI